MVFVGSEFGFFRSILLPQNEQFYVADSMWVNLANVAPAMFNRIPKGGVVIPLIFPKVPLSSLGILRVPQLPPALVRTL